MLPFQRGITIDIAHYHDGQTRHLAQYNNFLYEYEAIYTYTKKVPFVESESAPHTHAPVVKKRIFSRLGAKQRYSKR